MAAGGVLSLPASRSRIDGRRRTERRHWCHRCRFHTEGHRVRTKSRRQALPMNALRAKRHAFPGGSLRILGGPRCEPLLAFPAIPQHVSPRQTAGRPLPTSRGKSGLHGNTVPANGRRGRPQGQCHRKQTARAAPRGSPRARAKRCGKSAPRPRQQGRQGKPHREQDRIGAAVPQGDRSVPAPSPGLVARGAPRGASQRNGRRAPQGNAGVRTEPGLQAVWHSCARGDASRVMRRWSCPQSYPHCERAGRTGSTA